MPTTHPTTFPLPPPHTPLTLHPSFNPTTTGTTLWPSSRLLTSHLLTLPRRHLAPRYPSSHSPSSSSSTRPNRSNRTHRHARLKILDLGSGLGLVAIACGAALGADVVATDLAVVVDGALTANVGANRGVVAAGGGGVMVRVLDWEDALRGDEARRAGGEQEDGDDKGGENEEKEGNGEEWKEWNFDWITTSDTLYHAPLVPGLLATIERFAGAKTVVWMGFERRDGEVEERAREGMREMGWKGRRVRVGKRGGGGGEGVYGEGVEEEEGEEDCEVWRWERVRMRGGG
ncbi:hypothetical protein EX30DRAFT_382152 [Ascodesmis nigricans]|uniref:S-adenosyl-L-methionine-dependent methyltransferase n=1 Tax=Ascodesmis nigricans TaxID=341454 RepID=A0A4S2MSU2_9PEZI|nr:hypothetical protein EX30DRAFT_382152 [Ascodesmis nigricans]